MILNAPKVYTISDNGQEIIGGKEFNTSNNRLNYNLNFKSLGSFYYLRNSYNYSQSQLKMELTRSDEARKKLFNGYHASTGIFAVLSLVVYDRTGHFPVRPDRTGPGTFAGPDRTGPDRTPS